MGKIEADLFQDIHRLMPVCCVDIITVYRGGLLFIRRLDEPAKGQWWAPGGRIFKNEKLKDAASRILIAEVGLYPLHLEMIGVSETIFEEDPFNHGKGTHTVNVIFKAVTRDRDTPRLDATSSECIVVAPNDLGTLNLPSYLAAFANTAIRRKHQ